MTLNVRLVLLYGCGWKGGGLDQVGLIVDTQYLHNMPTTCHAHFVFRSGLGLSLSLGFGLGLGTTGSTPSG